MQLITLLRCCCCLGLIAASVAETQRVDVRNQLPGYIEFTIANSETFVPLTLTANISGKELRFSAIGDKKKTCYRNMEPQHMSADELIRLQLEYRTAAVPSAPRRQAKFEYTIQDKPTDTFSFNLDATTPLEVLLESPQLSSSAEQSQQLQQPSEAVACPPQICECDTTTEARLKYQEELLTTTLTLSKFNTRLVLLLHRPPGGSAVDTIRSIVRDKLALPQLAHSILQAKYMDEGLLFEMATPRDTVEVLTQARLRLQGRQLSIKPTERDFFEVASHYRMGV